MKKVLISTFAAAGVLASSAVFANDLVFEDSFFLNIDKSVEETNSVSSTSDFKADAPVKSSIFDGSFGSKDPR